MIRRSLRLMEVISFGTSTPYSENNLVVNEKGLAILAPKWKFDNSEGGSALDLEDEVDFGQALA